MIETASALVPFAAYHDPFLSGMAERQPPAEVVRYTFAALEAWSREHGVARGPEQTPQEFAQLVGATLSPVAREATILADLYNRCAYSRDPSQRLNLEPLRRLWQQLQQQSAVI